MGHFADIDRCVIWERNEGIRREVRTLRLKGQPRKTTARRSDSRLSYFFSKSTLPGRARNAG